MTETIERTIVRYRVIVASNHLNQRGWCNCIIETHGEIWIRLYMIDGQEVWFRDSELEVVEEMDYNSLDSE